MKNKFTTLLTVLISICVLSASFIFFGCSQTSDKKTLEKDSVLYFENANTSVKGLPFGLVLNSEESKIVLKKNGEISIKVKLADNLISTIENMFSVDINSYVQGYDLNSSFDLLVALFPGFDFKDLKGSINKVEKSFGLKITGLDFESEMIKNLEVSLAETGRVSDDFVIPEGLGLELNSTYYLKEARSIETEKTYTGIYIGNRTDGYSELGEPYCIMQLSSSENGKIKISYTNHVIDLHVSAKEIGYIG